MIVIGITAFLEITGVVRTEILKSKHLDLSEEAKSKIAEEGIYHITSKEAAEQIVKSGYILPTKGVKDNHFSKSRYGDNFADFVYMFAGKPSKELFKSNLSHRACKDGTIYAVKHTPNQYDINNYTERLEDSAITYEGRLDIANSNPELVRMKFEKGQLIEIPWNEPVKTNIFQKIGELPVIKFARGLPAAFRELNRNVVFRDKEGRLKACIAKRREENKMLQQYNNDTQQKTFEISKDGITYTISSSGTKMNDGKPLIGFRLSQEKTEFEKNIYMDAIDITTISDENLQTFLTNHMNEQSVRSEYIGKPVIQKDGVTQKIDEEYAHHFYEKQLMTVKNDATYAQYVEAENAKKKKQLGIFEKAFSTTTFEAKKDARYYIKKAKEKGLDFAKQFIKDERGGIILGG